MVANMRSASTEPGTITKASSARTEMRGIRGVVLPVVLLAKREVIDSCFDIVSTVKAGYTPVYNNIHNHDR